VVAVAIAAVGADPGVGRADRVDAPAVEPLEAAFLARPLSAGEVLRVPVPGAEGGKTVIGQLTVDRATSPGYVTAYGCDDGLPRDEDGIIDRSDLNFDGSVAPTWSNRLIVEADSDGDVCFYTHAAVEMVIDINAVSFDTGITSFSNRRTDTRLDDAPTDAGGVMRVRVPEAVGGLTVIGQLTTDRATDRGFVTAYGCADGLPLDDEDRINRSDLNYNGLVSPFRSNRLVVEADANGEVCLHTHTSVHLVVDINGVADSGIASFPNRRTDTRLDGDRIEAGEVLRVNVPEAAGSLTVVGQLTVDDVGDPGYVTAYGCADGLPRDELGLIARSDLNYEQVVSTSMSNRLIVEADADGDVCFFTLESVEMIVDINAVADAGITSFPNRRTDTRRSTSPGTSDLPVDADGIPVWPPYEPLGAVEGTAALTGLDAGASVTSRPILAVKIDNYRLARPHYGLDQADAIIEVNVEGVSRFIALFHSQIPAAIGPSRSARTTDLDLLAAMNRPIFAFSGANQAVTQWLGSADSSGVLVDYSAQRNGCYQRYSERPGPHNLILEPTCVLARGLDAGPARPLWTIDSEWDAAEASASSTDTTFTVDMDGVRVQWTWDAESGRYLRSQDDNPHTTDSGRRISASTVVELSAFHRPSTVDARSPHVVTLGSGSARVHRDGRSIAATWTRENPADPFAFTDATTGDPIPLDEGVTFLEFVRDR